jgi:hypothetical protein
MGSKQSPRRWTTQGNTPTLINPECLVPVWIRCFATGLRRERNSIPSIPIEAMLGMSILPIHISLRWRGLASTGEVIEVCKECQVAPLCWRGMFTTSLLHVGVVPFSGI